MKKTVFALAVLSSLSSVAVAQSQVTVYGLLDAGIVHEGGGAAGSVTKVSSGIANGSRLGFRGTEDLGGGLTAFFDIQNGFQADTGTAGQGGLLFGRQAYVGLGSRAGSVRLGRQYTPVDDLVGAVDPFGNGYAGRLQNVFISGYVARVNNDIMYFTPDLNGFSGNLAYGFGEAAGDNAASRYVGGSVGYAKGPLFARLAHQDSNNASNTGSAKNTMFGARYDFGPVKLHGALAVSKTDAAGVKSVDARDAMVGLSLPLGASTIMLSYSRRDDKLAVARDADQIAIGYNYSLSKRTTLYAAAARINRKNGATYTVGSATEAGSGNKAVDLGVRHTF